MIFLTIYSIFYLFVESGKELSSGKTACDFPARLSPETQ